MLTLHQLVTTLSAMCGTPRSSFPTGTLPGHLGRHILSFGDYHLFTQDSDGCRLIRCRETADQPEEITDKIGNIILAANGIEYQGMPQRLAPLYVLTLI